MSESLGKKAESKIKEWLDRPDTTEEWRPVEIPEFDGYYEVSNLGRVRTVDRWTNSGRSGKRFRASVILRLHSFTNTHSGGYIYVVLSKGSFTKNVSVHRLVAQAFIPNPNNLPQVNHIDGDKLNNRLDNLEWVSARDNILHAIHNNLMKVSDHDHMIKMGNLRGVQMSKPVKCIESGELYTSIAELGLALGIDVKKLYSILSSGSGEIHGKHYVKFGRGEVI